VKPILPFVEDASNWYVRRSRRRFWKSGDDADKQMAYRTLHYVLVRLSHVMAPFTPFLAEELHRNLTGGESVHLNDWIPAGHVNEMVLEEMAELREYVNQALSIRAQNRLKVRQPLALLSVPKLGQFVDFKEVLKEEVNVKDVQPGKVLELDLTVTPALAQEGMMREVIRNVQSARKKASLNVDDRIELSLGTDDKLLKEAIEKHEATIGAETLAQGNLKDGLNDEAYAEEVKVEGMKLRIQLRKAV
jgi:isoleucyl-tRNA synthetase